MKEYRIGAFGSISQGPQGYSEEMLIGIINGTRQSTMRFTKESWMRLLNKLVLYKTLKQKQEVKEIVDDIIERCK